MAVLFITHDLAVVATTCNHVVVMYAGRILEAAATQALFREPRHPYTRALIEALPSQHTKGRDLYNIPGMPPDLAEEIEGCPFAPRCEHALDACRVARCGLEEAAPGHYSACIRVQAGEL
ncbi:MAG TPA: ABC transporter ATP-binding protein [Candidatus Hydrogenedentes bacterium]|nr:ABC transporter ATP-binding protein [Candidatus Hydrogenedentota bacterium]